MPNEASWNQKANLLQYAREYKFPVILQTLEDLHITQQPMTQERYKSIRNAILANKPQQALKLLEPYKRGGETQTL
jgi:hypothetical protein